MKWKLRAGQRFLLRVPTVRLENVFVLPAGGVTSDGPRRIVFLQDGAGFREVEAVIAHQDDEVAIIPYDENASIFPGDVVVTSGAYALGLALNTGPQAVDAHHGHQH